MQENRVLYYFNNKVYEYQTHSQYDHCCNIKVTRNLSYRTLQPELPVKYIMYRIKGLMS